MIVKWQDEVGVSLFDYVVQVSKLDNENKVTFSHATHDGNLVLREYNYGSLIVLTERGTIISQFNLGPKPAEVEQPEQPVQ